MHGERMVGERQDRERFHESLLQAGGCARLEPCILMFMIHFHVSAVEFLKSQGSQKYMNVAKVPMYGA